MRILAKRLQINNKINVYLNKTKCQLNIKYTTYKFLLQRNFIIGRFISKLNYTIQKITDSKIRQGRLLLSHTEKNMS